MRSALARAAIRRGSSTMIFLFLSQGASSSARGTRVVLPAPGGATSTAALPPASACFRRGRASSTGRAFIAGAYSGDRQRGRSTADQRIDDGQAGETAEVTVSRPQFA